MRGALKYATAPLTRSRNIPASRVHRRAMQSASTRQIDQSTAPVAQWIEQSPPKGQVGRSIRLRGAILPAQAHVATAHSICPAAHPLPDRPARPARAPVRGERHRRRAGRGGPGVRACRRGFRAATWSASSRGTSSPCVRNATARPSPSPRRARTPGKRRRARGPLTVTAQVYAYDLSVRTAYLDAHARLLQRPVGVPASGGPRGRAVHRRHRGRRPARRRAGASPRRCQRDGAAPRGFGTLSRRRLRRVDRPSGGDRRLRATDRSMPAACRTRSRSPAASRPTCRGWRATWRACANGRSTSSAARRSLATCSRSRRWRRLRRARASGEHQPHLPPRRAAAARATTRISDDYLNLLGLASHEYFHAWNVKRIKPAAFVPYDLTQRKLHAAAVGVRRHHVVLRRPGARCAAASSTRARYLELLARAITHVLRSPGRRVQSVADSSFDAWIKYYRSDENTPNAVVSYYVKGALVACALDLTLRRDGSSSLDALMRALWERYGKPGIGVPGGRHPRAGHASWRGATSPSSSRATSTAPRNCRWPSMLAEFGVDMTLRAGAGARDRGGKPAAGAIDRCTLGMRIGADMKLAVVLRDGPAMRAGIVRGRCAGGHRRHEGFDGCARYAGDARGSRHRGDRSTHSAAMN